MRQLIMAALLAGAVGMLPNPTPADAQSHKLVKCLREAIDSCNEDFGGNTVYMAAARGYCYAIRGTICYVVDKHV